jgi:uncharacterized protein YdhG (YjbR/CyaY superfamily)
MPDFSVERSGFSVERSSTRLTRFPAPLRPLPPMQAAGSFPRTIDEYIAGFPPSVRPILLKVRATIRRAAPRATEAIKYRLPTFVLHGNLVHFGAFKKHLGFYATPSGNARFRAELAAYAGAKGSVQFPFDRPIPYALIARMVRFRVEENTARAGSKRKRAAAPAAKAKVAIRTVRHRDGTLWAKGPMSGKTMTGYWEWFRQDGTKLRSGHFAAGKQTGAWTTYDRQGKVHKVTDLTPRKKTSARA